SRRALGATVPARTDHSRITPVPPATTHCPCACLTNLWPGVYHWRMTRVAPAIPAEADLLCEFCGYTLNGLPAESNCPECGMPIASSLGQKRTPPPWGSAGPGTTLL